MPQQKKYREGQGYIGEPRGALVVKTPHSLADTVQLVIKTPAAQRRAHRPIGGAAVVVVVGGPCPLGQV